MSSASRIRHATRRPLHLATSPHLVRPRSITTATQDSSSAPASILETYDVPPPASTESSPRWQAIRQAKPFSDFLTDNFDRQHDYLRISLTERCNLRCLYCMPEEGIDLSPNRDILTTPEIHYLSTLFVNQGVNKIRLTGGEPTVRKDILPLMRKIGDLRRNGLKELALTTNGISLHRKLDHMVESGLTGVNISLDTLDPFQFQLLTRRQGFNAVMKSIDRVKEMNKAGAGIKLKINCVVMRGLNDHQVLPFVEMTKNEDLEVRFIEYMPFGGNKWSKDKMMSYADMLAAIRQTYPTLTRLKDARNDTSKTWHIPGFAGRIGFITSMTHNFCGTCNRLRITSDGNLKVCLHGNTEVSLRDMLRRDNSGEPMDEAAFEAISQIESGLKDEQLLEVIGAAVKRKKAKHAGMGSDSRLSSDCSSPGNNRSSLTQMADERHHTTHLRTPSTTVLSRLVPTHLLPRTSYAQQRHFYSTRTDPPIPFQSLRDLLPQTDADRFKPGSIYGPPSEELEQDSLTDHLPSTGTNRYKPSGTYGLPSEEHEQDSPADVSPSTVRVRFVPGRIYGVPSEEHEQDSPTDVLPSTDRDRFKPSGILGLSSEELEQGSLPSPFHQTDTGSFKLHKYTLRSPKEGDQGRFSKSYGPEASTMKQPQPEATEVTPLLQKTEEASSVRDHAGIRYVALDGSPTQPQSTENKSSQSGAQLTREQRKELAKQVVVRNREQTMPVDTPKQETNIPGFGLEDTQLYNETRASALVQNTEQLDDSRSFGDDSTAHRTLNDEQRKAIKEKKKKTKTKKEKAMKKNNAAQSLGSEHMSNPPTSLTHVNANGEAHMVDVGAKTATKRIAIARTRVTFHNQESARLIQENTSQKGDVLGAARIAGIMAAKRTSDLIPLCHPILLSKVEIYFSIEHLKSPQPHLHVTARVECVGPTGVEMEALTAASVAALTIYDMCKAVDKAMMIQGTRLWYKSGGKSGVFIHPSRSEFLLTYERLPPWCEGLPLPEAPTQDSTK